MTHTAGDKHPHGSYSTYTNWGCRCDPCKKANTEAVAGQRARRRASLTVPEGVAHGSHSTYTNWGCRCYRCREAQRDYDRRFRLRKKKEKEKK